MDVFHQTRHSSSTQIWRLHLYTRTDKKVRHIWKYLKRQREKKEEQVTQRKCFTALCWGGVRWWFACWRGRGSRQRGRLGCSSGDVSEGPPSLPEFWRTPSPWAAYFHWTPAHTQTNIQKALKQYQTIRPDFSAASISRGKLSKWSKIT